MREFLEKKLALYAKRHLAKTNPEVVGITGSVGKTSAKEAAAAVLATRFELMASPKNMNTEIGMPLAILGLPGGGDSKWRWLGILRKAWAKSRFGASSLPPLLVLEMAADRPGDIGKLVGIAPPKVGVVTAVSETHLELFGNVETVFAEKQKMVEALPADGVAVLNRDDSRVWEMRKATKARVISYGFHQEANVRVMPETLNYGFDPEGDCGMRFKVIANGSTVPMFVPGVLGRQAAYAGLVGLSVGLAKGMNLVEAGEGLRNFKPLPGRVRCLGGIKRTVLIDDSYNASPRSTDAALDIFGDLPLTEGSQRIAVLGDMLELGAASEQAHAEIGRHAKRSGVDTLVLVGERTTDTEKAALEAGMDRNSVFHFSGVEEAGRFVQERMRQADIILIKGSRGMRMEKVTKELMAEPHRAAELLVTPADD